MMAKFLLTIIVFISLWNLFFNLHGSHGRTVRNGTDIILKTVYGDEYHCVDIYKQPAFEHPALKNHRIPVDLLRSLEETSLEQERDEDSMFHPKNIWLGGQGCPRGTVPVSRATKPTAKPVFPPLSPTEFPMEGCSTDRHLRVTKPTAQPAYVGYPPNMDFAGIKSSPPQGTTYYGASAAVTLYNPPLKGDNEFSSAVMGVGFYDENQRVKIQVGWTVNPIIYGDRRTRLFSSWSGAQLDSGCYNDRCPGYVSLNRNIPLDYAFDKVSEPEKDIYLMKFELYVHQDTGIWYFKLSTKGIMMGYWPTEIFQGLLQVGPRVTFWGGLVGSDDNVSPGMGSGKFKNGLYDQTAYMRQVQVVDKYFAYVAPDFISTHDSRCYYEGDEYLSNDPEWQYNFLFGGAGGKDCVDCLY